MKRITRLLEAFLALVMVLVLVIVNIAVWLCWVVLFVPFFFVTKILKHASILLRMSTDYLLKVVNGD